VPAQLGFAATEYYTAVSALQQAEQAEALVRTLWVYYALKINSFFNAAGADITHSTV
jgi:hypothetical protein